MTVVGTRPELIRLSRIIAKIDECYDHIFVHTGQNYDYELNKIFFRDLDIREPDIYLGAAGKTPAETIGKIIIEIDRVISDLHPDALLILGDTNSTLAAIVAKRHKVPIFHMEAGNRCFDFRVPEEINRRIVDHISDINLTYTSIAREYLIQEGLPPDQIIKVGSPMLEVLNHYMDKILDSKIIAQLNLTESHFFLVSAHREENIDSDANFTKLVNVLNKLADEYDFPIIVSTHPRTQKKLNDSNFVIDSRIKWIKPLGFFDYVCLQTKAKAVLSDSGTITEESSILGFPALNIREVHERPEGMEEGSVMMVGLDLERVRQALSILSKQRRGTSRRMSLVQDYDVGNVSDKIINIIVSYTDYINKKVWKKY